MNFLSLEFAAFVVLCFLIYWQLPQKLRVGFLILASLIYYGAYSPAFLLHFIAVLAINFIFAHFLAVHHHRLLLALAVAANIAHLAFFKYFNSFWALFFAEGTGTFRVVMPLAISFYTFQAIAFLVDCYRGQVVLGFSRYLLFMLFFPHLISGPILRSHDFYAAIGNEEIHPEKLHRGLFLIVLGITKKVAVADAIGYCINPVYRNPTAYGMFDVLLAIAGYTAQLYCDFSGFIDIARGVAKLFGYDLPVNFHSPYFAASFSEFWNRWHITLSRFIRDYIYIPLGGNRVPPARQYFNLFTAMVLSGLWHGETLNFLIWGALHGLYLMFEKVINLPREAPQGGKWLLRNLWVVVGWAFSLVFFRAPDFTTAMALFRNLTVFKPAELPFMAVIALVFLTWLIQLAEEHREKILRLVLAQANYLLPLVLLFVYFLLIRIQIPGEAFIYVQF
ncbi:MAG: MBOAT family protein [Turneriella sp.]|nr:MBOAT family protein [Turneriella sp.]